MTIPFPVNTPRFKLTKEYLEHAASLFAPPGGAVLWRCDGALRVVRHGGEPLTVGYLADLAQSKPKRVVVDRLPPTIVGVYSTDPSELCHLPNLALSESLTAIRQAIDTDCVDSPR